MRVKAPSPPCDRRAKKVSFVPYFQRSGQKGATTDMGKYATNSAEGAQTIETLGGDHALNQRGGYRGGSAGGIGVAARGV